MPARKPKPNPDVERVFADFPVKLRSKLWALRQLIFTTARQTEGVGTLTETLKWGQPAYLTEQTKSGSTIRIGHKASDPDHYAMYFHCQTNLVEQFRSAFPNDFIFEGNRALLFHSAEAVPKKALALCIASALTYHRDKKSNRSQQ